MKYEQILNEATSKEQERGIAGYETIKKSIPFQEINYNPNKSNQTRYAFKQFQTLYNPDDPATFKYKGKLFPLFVKNDNNGVSDSSGIELGKWYRCGQGALQGAIDDKGQPVKYKKGELKGEQIAMVNSKLGKLSYRPGWHVGSSPLTRHIGFGKKSKDKDYDYMHAQNVWAVIEYSGRPLTDADTTGKKTSNGIKDFRDDDSFKNSYYHFKTNSSADKDEDWIIADAIKVVCVLNDDEVKQIAGDKAQIRNKQLGKDNNKFLADFKQFEQFDSNKNIEAFKKAKQDQERENRSEQAFEDNRKLEHERKAKELAKGFKVRVKNVKSVTTEEINYFDY